MTLSLHGTEPKSVFRLIGTHENSTSFALGWALEQSSHFRRRLIEAVFSEQLDIEDMLIQLQRHAEDAGYTDLEIQSGRQFHVVQRSIHCGSRPTAITLSTDWGRRCALPARSKPATSL